MKIRHFLLLLLRHLFRFTISIIWRRFTFQEKWRTIEWKPKYEKIKFLIKIYIILLASAVNKEKNIIWILFNVLLIIALIAFLSRLVHKWNPSTKSFFFVELTRDGGKQKFNPIIIRYSLFGLNAGEMEAKKYEFRKQMTFCNDDVAIKTTKSIYPFRGSLAISTPNGNKKCSFSKSL